MLVVLKAIFTLEPLNRLVIVLTAGPKWVQKWVPFTFFGPAVRRITDLFKGSNVKIAFRTTNTIQKQLSKKPLNQQNRSDIYSLKCNTCNKKYVGQSGRRIDTRYKEHIRYIRTTQCHTHILQNRHEYGPKYETLKFLKACNKGTEMNCWENIVVPCAGIKRRKAIPPGPKFKEWGFGRAAPHKMGPGATEPGILVLVRG